jgi:hypothetical protein
MLGPGSSARVAEGLSASEVGKEIAEHREHAEHAQHAEHEGEAGKHAKRDRWVTIAEAVMLSIVALVAAWSGYSAAKWGTESSLSLAKASATRNKASLASTQALQIRTLDSVSFNAWLATHPLTNPNAPPGPQYMAQYVVPQDAQAKALNAHADALFNKGEDAAGTADKYVRLTVLLAAVLFLVGIGSRFPLPVARYGLNVVAGILLVVSVIQLLGLPGPPS